MTQAAEHDKQKHSAAPLHTSSTVLLRFAISSSSLVRSSRVTARGPSCPEKDIPDPAPPPNLLADLGAGGSFFPPPPPETPPCVPLRGALPIFVEPPPPPPPTAAAAPPAAAANPDGVALPILLVRLDSQRSPPNAPVKAAEIGGCCGGGGGPGAAALVSRSLSRRIEPPYRGPGSRQRYPPPSPSRRQGFDAPNTSVVESPEVTPGPPTPVSPMCALAPFLTASSTIL